MVHLVENSENACYSNTKLPNRNVQECKVLKRVITSIAFLLMLTVAYGCNSKQGATKSAEQSPVAAKAVEAQSSGGQSVEVVFDPRNPPPGYVNCHRNHCHREGGGVSSYQQVMDEIGATKIVGVPKQAPMPSAPADVAAPPADSVKTASGLSTKVIKAGDGKAKPTAESVVTVHYTGWLTTGKAFDSSIARGQPAKFPVNRVIPGWTEGVQLMTVGEERRFWIPEELAYKGRPGAPPGMLVFDVELLSID